MNIKARSNQTLFNSMSFHLKCLYQYESLHCMFVCDQVQQEKKDPKLPGSLDSWVKIICIYTSLSEIEPGWGICISPVHMEGSCSQRTTLSLSLKEGQRGEVRGVCC